MTFLKQVGSVVSGVSGIVSGIQGLTGLTGLTGGGSSVGAASPGAARSGGAGFGRVLTPSTLTDVSGSDVGFFRTTGFNPNALEAEQRQRIRGIGSGLAGLRGDIPTQRAALGGIRSDLSTVRSRSGQLRGDVDTLRSNLGIQLGGLRDQVEPGFGKLTTARVKAVKDRRDEAIGNLRESLARRKVLGSSFADDAISRSELTFAQEEESARAQSFVEELGFSRQLAIDEAVTSGQLTEISGRLLSMDAAALGVEAQTIAVDMGLTQAEAGLFSQELLSIQSEGASLAQTLSREFLEIQLPANIANGIQAQVSDIAKFNAEAVLAEAQVRASDAAGLGGSIAQVGEGLASLGSIFDPVS